MTSSSSVIRSATISEAPVVIGAAFDEFLSPRTAQRLEAARREGFEAGYRSGHSDASSEAEQAVAQTRIAMSALLSSTRDEIDQAIRDRVPDVVDLALAIARTIVGSAADGASEGLAERIATALEELDDETITVKAHPDTARALGRLLPGHMDIVPDPTLQPGDATAVGRWARADLTIARAWANIEEALRA